ncbi:MAG: FHA domain-containing protein [Planctomycetota bacterium]|nr:FHA domain-containing protein [Planctomycetota bacterium]
MAKILVIDDDPTVLLFVTKYLEKSHEVFAFENWSQAMPTATTEKLDLALIDLNLRGFQGNDIVKFLRNMSTKRIYLFSAHDAAKLKAVSESCGADGYVQKILSPAQLSASIQRALRTPSTAKKDLRKETSRFKALSLQNEKRQSTLSTMVPPKFTTSENSMTLETLVNQARDLDREQFIARFPRHAILQLNQYEEFSATTNTQRTYVDNDDQTLARTNPKLSMLFFLKAKRGTAALETVTVGRSHGSDIFIDTPRVSKFHAYFRNNRDGQWSVRDSRSTNGTFLNGRKLKVEDEAPLRRGSLVAFSEALRFKFLSPEELFTRVRMYRSVFS